MIFNYLGDVSGESEKGRCFEPDSADGFSAGLDYCDPRNRDGADLQVNCLVDGGRFTLWLDYNRARFTRAQAQSFARFVLDNITTLSGFLNAQAEPLPETASDLGENEWSPEEFEAVMAKFADRGETIQRIYPLTPMQEGMLLEHVTHPESRAYRLIDIYECARPLDEGLLRHVIDMLAQKHEALRTAIIHKGVSRFRQAIVDRRIPLTVVDLTGSEDPFAEARKIRLDLLDHGYDLQDRPLTQFFYAKTGQGGYLIFATHHIVADGWCFETIFHDLNALLRGETLTGDSDGQYERAVREQLRRDKNAAVRYFRKLLESYENSAVIPSFGGVPEEERATDDQIRGALPAKTAEKLSGLCRSAGATLADGFNLAWGLVLRTLNRTEDVVFTTVASGRDGYTMNVSDLVGLFINPVPVRVNLENGATPKQALQALHRQAVETKPYDFCPLADIRNALGGNIRLDGLIVSFENYTEGGRDETLLNPVLIKEEHGSGSVGVDAAVQIDGSISVLLSFDPALYRKAEMERLLALFQDYAARITETPDAPLHALPHLDDEGVRGLLRLSRGEKLDYDINQTWLDLFKVQAEKTPDTPAVTDSEGSFTYGELNQVSDSIAAYLLSEGIQENSFVAVRIGRVKEFIAAVIGVQKTGAAYVPIDPVYPEDRIRYMLEDSGSKVTLDETAVSRMLTEASAAEPVNRTSPDHRAYMIYTSGSTGKPKGVVIRQSALRAYAAWAVRDFGYQEGRRYAHSVTFSFDASVTDIVCTLSVGAEIHILSNEMRMAPPRLAAYLRENQIHGVKFPTQLGMLMLNNYPDLFPAFTVLGGEKLLPVARTRVLMYNEYGPTEFTVGSSVHLVDQEKDTDIPIGRPVPNTWSLICDACGRLLPAGMTGELCLAGRQTAEGYWHRPELTAEKFADCPFLPGMKMYRTGDLARYNEAGELECLGRIDNQVKLRGFRIEMGEIENVCMSCPGVSTAAADVKNSGSAPVLCLYYTQKPGETADIDALKALCRQRLADYMVPSFFMRVDAIPLTPNGKINRKALPEPEITSAPSGARPTAPLNLLEQALHGMVAEIVHTGDFGITDNLRDFGLSSLSGIRLSVEVYKKFGVNLNARGLISDGTIQSIENEILAELLSRKQEDTALPSMERSDYPLSMTQAGIFVDSMRFADSTVYNTPFLYRLDAAVDMERLRAALEKVILAHPVLSMTLRRDGDGNIRAVRHAPEHIDIPVEDAQPPAEQLVRPFDLISGEPLYRAGLYDTQAGKHLFLDIHHIASDGVSLGILLNDLDAAYAGKTVEQETYTGFDAALDEEKARATEAYATAKTWYDNALKGCEPCTRPLPEPGLHTDAKIAAGRTRGETDANAVRSFCEKHDLTQNAFFTEAFAVALKAYTGAESAVFCTIYNGRMDPRTYRSVSMFVKTLPVAMDASGEQTVIGAIAAYQDYLLGAMGSDLFSFAEIREAYGIEPDVLFSYQGEGRDQGPVIGGFPAESQDLSLSQTKAAFGLDVSMDDAAIVFETEYDPRMYSSRTADGFVRLLDRVCGEMLIREKLKDISLTGDADERAILALHDTRLARCGATRLPAFAGHGGEDT